MDIHRLDHFRFHSLFILYQITSGIGSLSSLEVVLLFLWEVDAFERRMMAPWLLNLYFLLRVCINSLRFSQIDLRLFQNVSGWPHRSVYCLINWRAEGLSLSFVTEASSSFALGLLSSLDE